MAITKAKFNTAVCPLRPTGGVDEPMFLIGRGQVSVVRFDPNENGSFELSHSLVVPDDDLASCAMQGMRVVYHSVCTQNTDVFP